MFEWQDANWSVIKSRRGRYIGIEINGEFCVVDTMPLLNNLLSFPHIHDWQKFPLYRPSTPDAEAWMRAEKYQEEDFLKARKQAKDAGYIVAILGSLAILTGFREVFLLFMMAFALPGWLGIFEAILVFSALYYLYTEVAYRRTRPKALSQYYLSPVKISIRYRQALSTKMFVLGFSIVAFIFTLLVYIGGLPAFFLGLLVSFMTVYYHIIPDYAKVQYRLSK